jgi:transcriptional regulator with XRE-family HTH domain
MPEEKLSQAQLGARLKAFRERSRKTFITISGEVGLTISELVRAENGHLALDATTILKFAECYGVQISDFYSPYAFEDNWEQILGLFYEGEISESYAAHLLGGDRLAFRTLAEGGCRLVIERNKIPRHTTAGEEAILQFLPKDLPILTLGKLWFQCYEQVEQAEEATQKINEVVTKTCAWVLLPRKQYREMTGYKCRRCSSLYSLDELHELTSRSPNPDPRCGHGWSVYAGTYNIEERETHWRVTVDISSLNEVERDELVKILEIDCDCIRPVILAHQKVYARYWDESDAREMAGDALRRELLAFIEEVDAV